MKTCVKCGETKPVSEFYPRYGSPGKTQGHCKACHYLYTDSWRRRNLDHTNVKGRVYQGASRHGLALAVYRELIKTLGDKCEACGTSLKLHPGATERRTALQIDHDHATGEFRGVLCMNCNTALGLLDDDAERIANLAAYLRRKQIAAIA